MASYYACSDATERDMGLRHRELAMVAGLEEGRVGVLFAVWHDRCCLVCAWRVFVSDEINEAIDRDQNVRIRSCGELDPLIRVTLALFVIGLTVWLLLARTAYRREYSGTGVAWHRGPATSSR